MKKSFSPFHKPRTLAAVWLIFHGGLALSLGISILLGGPLRINTNLFDLLPSSHGLKSVESAEKALADKNGRQVYILAGNPEFAQAKQGAVQVYNAFADSGVFETLSLSVNAEVMAQFTGYLYEYRYVLLDPETRSLLEKGGAAEVAEDALSSAFGAFNFVPLDTIEGDPFLLTDRELGYFLGSALLSSGALSLREEVLSARHEGIWYVLLRGTLSRGGVSLTNKDSAIEKIYQVCTEVQREQPGTVFIYSGVPFHSYESSSKAQGEISLISTITLIIIIALFWYAFRSPLPVLVSALAVVVSILFAAGSALLWFREIHILTFVFGTTLIGTCVDYSIHYFVHWKGNPALAAGTEIRSQILRGITLCFISTGICFLALFLAPFRILKQFSVFSLTGLLSAFLSVVCLYPLLPLRGFHPRAPIGESRLPEPLTRLKKIGLALIVGGAGALLFINRSEVRIANNLSGLYTMSGALLESEKTAAQVLNHGSSGWYFIISGADPEEVLEREEALRARLDTEIIQGNLQSYAATSLFIPSLKTQKRNYEAAQGLLPLAAEHFQTLGFSRETEEAFRRDFAQAQERYVLPGGELPPYLRELVANLWLGSPEGKTSGPFYACVLPLHTQDEAPFRAIDLEGVFFVNKVKDLGAELDTLTKITLGLFLAAYLLIALLIRRFYSWKQTLRICGVPFLLILVSLTTLACLHISLGFFSVVGLVLVFGLGLDYMFYLTESGKDPRRRRLTVLAMVLSFVTTALSFGALSLSTFVPVHIFGITVFAGLTTAFISSLLME